MQSRARILCFVCLSVALSAGLAASGMSTPLVMPEPVCSTAASADTSGPGSFNALRLAYYEPAGELKREEFNAFISSLLNFYLSEHITLRDEEFRLKKSPEAMSGEMAELVSGAVSFYNHRSRTPFDGFSGQLRGALQKLERQHPEIDAFGDNGPGREALRRMLLESNIRALHTAAMKEVRIFSASSLMVLSASDEAEMDPQTMERIVEEMLAYDPRETLQPLPGDDNRMVQLSLQDNSTLSLPGAAAGEEGFAQKVYEMLAQQNAKLDNMQAQIDQVRADQLSIWKSQQEKTNADLQSQILELRNTVVRLVEGLSGTTVATAPIPVTPLPAGTPVTNLPSEVTLRFAKNSDALDAVAQLSLNEVVDILARNPGIRIVITGHADRTGTEIQNLILSNRRAQSVKNFFTATGLDASRFVTRYLGQRDSYAENPSDRKVTLAFIP